MLIVLKEDSQATKGGLNQVTWKSKMQYFHLEHDGKEEFTLTMNSCMKNAYITFEPRFLK